MPRYIDADAINYHEDDAVYRHEIDLIPTADVKPVVRGEWVYPYETTTMVCHCSICGAGGNGKYNYCPNCGAEMRGDSNDC